MLKASRPTTILAFAAIAALVSCVPPEGTTEGNKNPTPPEKTEPPAPQPKDIALDGFEAAKIEGEFFAPGFMGKPPFLGVPVKDPKLTLKKQRKILAKSRLKPEQLGAETAVLVTLIFKEFKNIGSAEQRQLLAEAQQALTAAKTAMGEAFDAVLLQMQINVEIRVDNEAGALAAATELTTRFPDSELAQQFAAWTALMQLRAGQTAEAMKLTAGWDVANFKPGTGDYLSAYALAWSQFRAGNYGPAAAAMTFATRNWKKARTKPTALIEMFLMHARAGTPVEQVLPILAEQSDGSVEVQYDWLYQMYLNYDAAGYPVNAADALEAALKIRGDDVPPIHRVSIRQRQHNAYLAAHQMGNAALNLIAAYKALTPCGDPCKDNVEPLAGQIKGLAGHLYSIFRATQDERFFEPSKQLYDYYISLGRPDAELERTNLTNLLATKKDAPKNSGEHELQTMSWSIDQYNKPVKRCYESVLQREPDLAGSIKLTLELDTTGAVVGVNSDPAPGQAGVAAIGSCLRDTATKWRFPGRSKPGKTTLTRTYNFTPKAPPAPPTPAPTDDD